MNNKERLCQLCGINSRISIEIFSDEGIELGMKSILFQHFSLKFTETDEERKSVCTKCWKVTDEFHKLYCLVQDYKDGKKSTVRSKPKVQAEENYGSPMVELDFINVEVKLESLNDASNSFAVDHDESNGKPTTSQLQPESQIKEELSEDVNIIEADCRMKSTENTEKLTAKQKQAIEQDKEIINSLGFVCELCDKNFKSFVDLSRHFRCKHKGSAVYVRCCGKKLKTRFLIYNHVQDHKNPVPVQCPVCDKSFMNKISLKLHMKRHDPSIQKMQCPNCPKLFEVKSYLDRHIKRIHFTGPKTFICDICGKGFMTKLRISSHMVTVHIQKYSLICDICAKPHKTIKLLDTHYKTKHLGIQLPKVQCSICNAWLGDKNILRNHVKLHYAKQEMCSICEKNYPNRNALYNHVRKVHSGLTFPCTMCEKTFKHQAYLTQHIATHTGFSLYKCKYCNKDFKFSSSLSKHHKDVHPIESEKDRRQRVSKPSHSLRKICDI